MSRFDIGDYNDVAGRLAEFRSKHPEGSLQPADPSRPYEVRDIGGKTYIVVVAAAYRTPDDARPGIGMAYEQFPGRTPYTRDSELQNAETSAWGRAIVAALAADTKKGIASADEVRNRQAERDEWEQTTPAGPSPRSAELLKEISEATSPDALRELWGEVNAAGATGDITGPEAVQLKAHIGRRGEQLAQPEEPPAAEQSALEGDWPQTTPPGGESA